MDRARIYTPDVLVSENTVIVTSNHLGASMETPCGEPYGDAGRDAQHLANISGQLVIGLDRPLTGNGQKYDGFQSQLPSDHPESIASAWVSKIAPALKETGAKNVELVAKSAGANLLLEVAILELLPVTGIAMIDPLTIHKMSPLKEKLFHAKYQMQTARQKRVSASTEAADITELVYDEAQTEGHLTKNLRMLRRQLKDIQHNQQHWASEKGFLACALIAARLRHTKTLFTFADRPLGIDREDLEPSIISMNALRSKKAGAAPLLADFVPNTTHCSFDNPRIYTAQYERFRALGRNGDVYTRNIETVETDLL